MCSPVASLFAGLSPTRPNGPSMMEMWERREIDRERERACMRCGRSQIEKLTKILQSIASGDRDSDGTSHRRRRRLLVEKAAMAAAVEADEG